MSPASCESSLSKTIVMASFSGYNSGDVVKASSFHVVFAVAILGGYLLAVSRSHKLVQVPDVEPYGPTITAGLQPPRLDSTPEGNAVKRGVLLGPCVIEVRTLCAGCLHERPPSLVC